MLRPSQVYMDRREGWRYRFGQPLRYCVARQGVTWLGTGQTIELGSVGALISTDYPLQNGEIVEIRLVWPVLAQGMCPVVLVFNGTVVRNDVRGTALRARNYVFQMADSCSSDGGMDPGAACNLIA